jgi:hypothetical protein
MWYHQQESNLYLALRRRSFYPLNYGGKKTRDRIVGGSRQRLCAGDFDYTHRAPVIGE